MRSWSPTSVSSLHLSKTTRWAAHVCNTSLLVVSYFLIPISISFKIKDNLKVISGISHFGFSMGSVGVATSHHLYPPFPEDITTAPLVSISLSKLEAGNESESKAFFEAAQNLGFFYMKLEGSALGERIINGAEALHGIQQEFFKRPNEEKENYAREKIDAFMGYRRVELKENDEQGRPKRNETYNVSRTFAVSSLPSLG